jgi:aspartyl protease family protein
MRGFFALCLVWPSLTWAGAHDYFECVGPGGDVAYSVERCPKGQTQRQVASDEVPATRKFAGGSGGLVKLESGRGGHFYATVTINGAPVRAVVDTGATTVAISPAAARRSGLGLKSGVAVQSYTANGISSGTGIVIDAIELGGNVVRNVPCIVLAADLGPNAEALLGMAFLKHFDVSTDGYLMTLRPK